MILTILYAVNAIINTILAFYYKELGYINCAIQLWLCTLIFAINKM